MSTTDTLDVQDLRHRVRGIYQEVAEHPEHTFHFETGRDLAERLGYPADDLDTVPTAAVDSFAGVGYFLDLAGIAPGTVVVDLGSGSGTDVFLAARRTGAAGRVVGIDMTPAQLTKAAALASAAGLGHVQFRQGHIEDLPLESASVDVVISNGVINLAPDKHAVFREAARVLRPGGRLALADIVTVGALPHDVVRDAALWAACIGGAMRIEDYLDAIAEAGLQVETVRDNTAYRFLSASAVAATERWGVRSVSLTATRA